MKPFDIRERTFQFSIQVINFADQIPNTVTGQVILRQLVRAGTSIGANVEEANGAESRQDFIHKMKIALKEAQETRYWLRIVRATKLNNKTVEALIQESDELVRILNTIIHQTKTNNKRNRGQ